MNIYGDLVTEFTKVVVVDILYIRVNRGEGDTVFITSVENAG